MKIRAIRKTVFLFLSASLSIGSCPTLQAQDNDASQFQLTDFQMQSSTIVGNDGAHLSDPQYQSTGKWFATKVPSTVLNTLVNNGVYPDPYQGLNNMRIPDASDKFNETYDLLKYSHLGKNVNPWKKPYWFITNFDMPSTSRDKHIALLLQAINYRAAVWVNGKLIADSSQVAGMFGAHELDISHAVKAGQKNGLAIKIYPLDYAGEPDSEQLKALGPFFLNGGPTGDIGKNVTMLCSVGWDWMPPVRDRNMGIWQPVYIRTTGKVAIEHPKITTDLRLPDTTQAFLSLEMQLHNFSKRASKGEVVVRITPENFKDNSTIAIAKKVTVTGRKAQTIQLSYQDIKELVVNNPKLWWPNGYGTPNLYRIQIQYKEGNEILDGNSFVFGIRTVSSMSREQRGVTRRDFFVNGKRIHLIGGAWVPDLLLNRDSVRNFRELELCRNANNNLIRIWGGGVTPEDPFWDACDRNGLLVWSDFWITGDTQGEFKGSPDYPLDGKLFIDNVVSTIYRVRNHASLLVWTGGNEGHARKELYNAIRDNVVRLDGTRPFIPNSSGYAHLPADWQASWPDNRPSGVYSGGPYAWKDPKHYFALADTAKDWVFKDETGIPSQPPLSTLDKIIPDTTWDRSLPFPLNDSWGYHDAATGAGQYDKYYNEMVKRYGTPTTKADFSQKMQLLNWLGYQGIFEAAEHRLNDNGGVMLWKLNAAFPSVIWQIYDWYLQPNAGYYAMQNACEKIHIQLNPRDSSVEVFNRTYQPVSNLKAEISIWNIKGEAFNTQSVNGFGIDTSTVKKITSLQQSLNNRNGASLVALRLKNEQGQTVSRNTYWLAPNDDYKSMTNMQVSTLAVRESSSLNLNGTTTRTYVITNTGKTPAFFVNLRLMQNGEELHHALWSANYITLLPGESQSIKVSYSGTSAKVTAEYDGWNVSYQKVAGRSRD
ncbi:MAG: glycoside hydrolase family 2 TIM barrel-domain containing protein [Chitinophagaceae bacterium]